MNEKIQYVLSLLADYDPNQLRRDRWDNRGQDTAVLQALVGKAGKVHCGMTKICIVFKDWDWVVKLDRKHYKECAREAAIYEDACLHRVERAFLETRFIGETANSHIPVYIQPKIAYSCQKMPRAKRKAINLHTTGISDELTSKISHSLLNGDSRLSGFWIRAAVLVYGKKFMLEFEKVVNKWQIDDLHENNVGFKDGKPVLLDYSGYDSDRASYE